MSAPTNITDTTTNSIDIAELRARASAGERAAGRPATLALGADLPTASELRTMLACVPVAGVRLAPPVDFDRLPGDVLVQIVALLRECSSIGVRVTWSLVSGPDKALDHLPAPEGRPRWRSANTFGLFYFRRGPGFLSVVDRRPESIGRTTVAEPALLDAFHPTLDGCAWDGSAAVRRLVELGLVMRFGDHCVALPVHMRTWPIGAALLGGTLASAGKNPDKKV
ncbi:DUF5825 family protein [Labedaea rhizosphaerae]|uniref:Uncharacterized protein n=1 Tax=Labedaea rhizosphaerae TaxID=598644 RepID=A0A4R6RSR7_LABRH|nr:DUF5825 family protein [Labedaea rhizosphaerae]TDP89929.1 hypothetical protein EV186_11155 [Labedaea rhizosphaerae]